MGCCCSPATTSPILLPRLPEPPENRSPIAGALLEIHSGDQRRRLLLDPASHNNNTNKNRLDRSSTRRIFSLMLFPFAIPLSSSPSNAGDLPIPPPARDGDNLERYTDEAEGFTLLKPSSWRQVEKAGATALFEEEGKGSNNIGVVVNPVRLSSLQEFGSPQFVADKLIQAERRKESTKFAEVVSAVERFGRTGLAVYEFEYTVDSTRGGMKRIFSAAFVDTKKLYLLNVTHSDSLDNPLDNRTRVALQRVLHSFDAAS